MRSPNTTLLLIVVFFSSCIGFDNDSTNGSSKAKRGITSNAGFHSNTTLQSNGVAIEEATESNRFINSFNTDNEIYRPGRSWRYKFTAAKDNILQALEVNRKGEWQLVPASKRRNPGWKRVDGLTLEVEDGFGPYQSDFNQTVVKYTYLVNGREDGNESFTGLVENSANVWLHPIRTDLFEILALNPYPFVQKPLEVGKRFEFKLPVNENWSNPEWKKWFGTLRNNCRYEIVKKRSVELPFGKLNPFTIMSNCQNELGNTGLIAYFDEEMGFVKLDYRNIDNSWLSFELMEAPF